MLKKKIKKVSKLSQKLNNLSQEEKIKILEECQKEMNDIQVLETTIQNIDDVLEVTNTEFNNYLPVVDHFKKQTKLAFEKAEQSQEKNDFLYETADFLDNLDQVPQILESEAAEDFDKFCLKENEQDALVPN